MRKGKIFGLLTIFLIGILYASFASATITISEVELDDDALSATSTNFVRDVDRGDSFEVKVHLSSNIDVDDVQVEAAIRGYDHGDLMEDITDVFDMKTNVTYVKKLNLELRSRMDQDTYSLRVRAEGKTGATTQQDYYLEVDTKRHLLRIKDIVFSPENEVRAGRALLTSVRVENMGESKEEGIRVRVTIPELGISASDFIDELDKSGDSDDEATSEELYMRIPQCATAGDYDVKIEVIYDEGDEKVSRQSSINVIDGEACELVQQQTTTGPETIITVGTETQDVAQGLSVIYPLTITNKMSTSKTYTVAVDGVDAFGSASISPSNVLTIASQETKAAYVSITASNEATAGEHMFNVAIGSDGTTLKQLPLKSNVVKAAKTTAFSRLKRGLEIGLVILVVLLVILGLIIGFNKLKGSEEEEEPSSEDGKTYY